MAELNKELAKLFLEQKGFLVALDVTHEDMGYEAPGFDVLGVEIEKGMVSQAIVGVVRGWWHSGSYLTPGLIRAHLESDRHLLSESFSFERIQYIRNRYGLGVVPIHNVLFYSQRSPGKSKETERILSTMNIEVVYLEDVIIEMLPKVGKLAIGDPALAQLLSMVRYSRLFREMRKAIKNAERCEGEPEEKNEHPVQLKPPDPQLDFISRLSKNRQENGKEKIETENE